MKRKYTIKDFVALCNHIFKQNPLASITTDYIVGYPTETIDDFAESFENIRKINFSDIHIFPFSVRPFTPASKLKERVPDLEKKKRFDCVNNLKKELQISYLDKFIGKNVTVLFEKSNIKGTQTGHSEYFFKVNVKTSEILTNKMLTVKITKLVSCELFGILL